MKSFAQFIIEMAPPRDSDRNKVYYHGTSKEEAIKGILKNGIQPPDLTNRKGNLRPVDGKVYITPHLKYAVIYAIGGDMAGSTLPHRWIDQDPYGYVCVIKGDKLGDSIQPDEDDIGRFIHDEKLDWLNELAEEELRHEEYEDSYYDDETDEEVEDTRPLLDAVMDGEYDAWALAGKLLLQYLTDDQKLALIDAGAHVAHHGALKPDEVWKFDKTKCANLKKDGSNFFELGERVR